MNEHFDAASTSRKAKKVHLMINSARSSQAFHCASGYSRDCRASFVFSYSQGEKPWTHLPSSTRGHAVVHCELWLNRPWYLQHMHVMSLFAPWSYKRHNVECWNYRRRSPQLRLRSVFDRNGSHISLTLEGQADRTWHGQRVRGRIQSFWKATLFPSPHSLVRTRYNVKGLISIQCTRKRITKRK